MKIDLAGQQEFFDDASHRVDSNVILNPTRAHNWEYEQLLAPLNNLKPAETVIVDMGSGSGRLTFELLRRGFQVIAYDISVQSLKNLTELYLQHRQTNWGGLKTTNHLPKAGSANAIVGCDILHHVPLLETLKSWRQLLKPDGLALFSEPNAFYLLWYLHLITNKIPWKIEKGLLQCWPTNLENKFLKAGFKTFQVFGHGLLPTPVQMPQNFAQFNALQLAKKLPNLAFRLQIQAS